MRDYLFALLCISLFVCTSCSLKYREETQAESTNPEFIFTDAQIEQIENNKKTLRVKASLIEKYKNSDNSFAKDVDFKTFEKDGSLESEGKCDYLKMNSQVSEYEMYDNIQLFSKKHNAFFYSDVIKWNGKTEQLISGRNQTVKVKKDDTTIIGSGFSASGVTGKYQFTGVVSGVIEDSKENDVVEGNTVSDLELNGDSD